MLLCKNADKYYFPALKKSTFHTFMCLFLEHEIDLLRQSLPSGQYKMAQTTRLCRKVFLKKIFKVLNMRNLTVLSNL